MGLAALLPKLSGMGGIGRKCQGKPTRIVGWPGYSAMGMAQKKMRAEALIAVWHKTYFSGRLVGEDWRASSFHSPLVFLNTSSIRM